MNALPLAGIRVVELGTFITGPYAAALLGDMGADVVKIEPPQGDPMRGWSENAYAPYFQAYNKSKRSIALDLRDDDDQNVAQELIAGADVVIHNYRPGVAERLGIGAEQSRERNPLLVYCQISGFGTSGPYATRPSYNQVVQSLSGLDSLLVDERSPAPIGPNFGDTMTAVYASHAVLGALVRRARTGEGTVVDVTMTASMLSFLSADVQDLAATGVSPGPTSRARFSQSYMARTRDGLLLTVHLSSPEKFWSGLLTTIGRLDLAEDPRFRTWADRTGHYAELQAELAVAFAVRDREEWLELLERNDIPSAPVNDIAGALADPQVQHLGVVADVEDEHGSRRIVASPARLDGMPLWGRPAPFLDEHADEIRAGSAWTVQGRTA